MELSDLLTRDHVVAQLDAKSKKQALQELSNLAAAGCSVDAREIFETLLQRERLGSTGVGHGVAIPHGKFEKLDKLCGIFAKLDQPIDFDAMDNTPVDLIFLLLAPESAGADHLKALARIARTLRDPAIAAKLRGADNAEAIFAALNAPATSNAA